jgi:hypothetical protein
MARTGKIAQLPKPIREELNTRLDNGQLGPEILAWLNATPECQAVVARFDGKPVNAQNLSAWRAGGFEDWRRRDATREQLQKKAERCFRIAQEVGGHISEGAAAILGGKFLDILEKADKDGKELDADELLALTKSVVALRSGSQTNIKLEQAERDLDRKDQELDATRRTAADMVLKAANDARVQAIAGSDTDHAAKLEAIGRMMFGDDWRNDAPQA